MTYIILTGSVCVGPRMGSCLVLHSAPSSCVCVCACARVRVRVCVCVYLYMHVCILASIQVFEYVSIRDRTEIER